MHARSADLSGPGETAAVSQSAPEGPLGRLCFTLEVRLAPAAGPWRRVPQKPLWPMNTVILTNPREKPQKYLRVYLVEWKISSEGSPTAARAGPPETAATRSDAGNAMETLESDDE